MRTIIIFLTLILISCEPERSDDPIPFEYFNDIVVNLTLPVYVNLSSDGGSVYVNGGVRGIILYRKSASTYLAFERNCSFQPNEAGSTVDIHSSTLFMQDTFCGSSFNFDGDPTGAPAWRPLQQYKTSLSGNTLTIMASIVE